MKPKRALQESIPARCVPPASVATTRCQHCRCTLQGKVYLLGGGCTCKEGIPGVHQIYPPNEGTYYQEYIPPGTWYQPGLPIPRGQTHACENTTFQQLRWWAVIIGLIDFYVSFVISIHKTWTLHPKGYSIRTLAVCNPPLSWPKGVLLGVKKASPKPPSVLWAPPAIIFFLIS